jgi:hypothetical protein
LYSKSRTSLWRSRGRSTASETAKEGFFRRWRRLHDGWGALLKDGARRRLHASTRRGLTRGDDRG